MAKSFKSVSSAYDLVPFKKTLFRDSRAALSTYLVNTAAANSELEIVISGFLALLSNLLHVMYVEE